VPGLGNLLSMAPQGGHGAPLRAPLDFQKCASALSRTTQSTLVMPLTTSGVGNGGARQHHQAELTSPPPWLCPGSPGSCPATSATFRASNARGSELLSAPRSRD
jgi:hypothetical protein